jgi:hypothetical protein
LNPTVSLSKSGSDDQESLSLKVSYPLFVLVGGEKKATCRNHCSLQRLCSMSNFIEWKNKEKKMSAGTIILIIVVLMLIGAFPTWPHSRSWGYGPAGGVGLILTILIILLLLGRI